MNYALGHAFNLHHMFYNFPAKKMKTHFSVLYKRFLILNKNICALIIFKECVKLVIRDIIENNDVFVLPLTGKVKAHIKMKATTDEEFVKARKNGKFRNVDFLKSFWTGYSLVFVMHTKGYERVKPIYVDKSHKNRLDELTNQGKQYG